MYDKRSEKVSNCCSMSMCEKMNPRYIISIGFEAKDKHHKAFSGVFDTLIF